ncbi:BZ3500_MvSof-1268-A1-R1_Chr3-2g06226 [Microbotryum saponariae]|uniref:BZ3500_MvSof-1268-A1-R1_Chr3-2g06226 protein n=1 Tax=Microbotryum saponariae TaxID=289078 RepID=A0A2X0N0Y2_9BASI|nr:BZ3500_MvSof-1268-A1-R1_Chr3-2g06226 [Microbotryum saponariae]SDA04157.1 BZ3501_MvSof-1269-A2-R1_Chr3-2g05917 [Microbotryum saponariae]
MPCVLPLPQGVNGLWSLLTPVARPVNLDALERKRLAIDASIWLYQFQMTMRDKKSGDVLKGAHVMGTFRRIMKLIYHGIRPVFVFDGKAPMLKMRTIDNRRKRKQGAGRNAAKTAQLLLSAQLRAAAAAAALRRLVVFSVLVPFLRVLGVGFAERELRCADRRGPDEDTLMDTSAASTSGNACTAQKLSFDRDTGERIDEHTTYLEDLEAGIGPSSSRPPHTLPKTPSRSAGPTKTDTASARKKHVLRDEYALPEIAGSLHSRIKPTDVRLATEAEQREFLNEMRPEFFDSADFASLSTQLKYEIIGEQRLKSRQVNHRRVQEMKTLPSALDFSQSQIANLVVRNQYTQKLFQVTDELGQAAIQIPTRIAGERNRMYQLIKQDPSKGTGYVLAVQNPELTKDTPIVIDTTTDESSDGTDSDEFEEVGIAKYHPKRSDVNEVTRQAEVLELLRARHEMKRPPVEIDPYLDVVPVEGIKSLFGHDRNPPSPVHSSHSINEDEGIQAAIHESTLAPQHLESADFPGSLKEGHSAPAQTVGKCPTVSKHPTVSKWLPRIDDDGDSDSAHEAEDGQTVQETAPRQVISARSESSDSDYLEEIEIMRSDFVSKSEVKPDASSTSAGSRRSTSPLVEPSPVASVPRTPPPTAPTGETPSLVLDPTAPEFVWTTSPAAARTPSPSVPTTSTRISQGGIEEEALLNEIEADGARNGDPSSERDSTLSGSAFAIVAGSLNATSAPVLEALTPDRNGMGLPQGSSFSEHPANVPEAVTPPQQDDSENSVEEFLEWERSPTPPRLAADAVEASESSRASETPHLEHKVNEDEGVTGDSSGDRSDDDHNEEGEVIANLRREQAQYADILSQLKNRRIEDMHDEAQADIASLSAQRNVDQRNADGISRQMENDIKELLSLFGLPFVDAPQEAEAECADLLSRKLVDGIVTDDSDVFLFGGASIYRNMFNDDKFIECYLLADLDRELGLDRKKLVRLAHLLGSDYTEGLPGVGPVLGRELLEEFPGDDGLSDFKKWWTKVQSGRDGPEDTSNAWRRKFKKGHKDLVLEESWPTSAIVSRGTLSPMVWYSLTPFDHVRSQAKAYLAPVVSGDDEPFEWGSIDLDGIRAFLARNLSWGPEKVNGIMLPLLSRQKARSDGTLKRQGFISEFESLRYFRVCSFDVSVGTGPLQRQHRRGYASSRLQSVLDQHRAKTLKKDTSKVKAEPEASTSEIPSSATPNEIPNQTAALFLDDDAEDAADEEAETGPAVSKRLPRRKATKTPAAEIVDSDDDNGQEAA